MDPATAGSFLRALYGITGPARLVDLQSIAHDLGVTVDVTDLLHGLDTLHVDDTVAVAARLCGDDRAWCVARALGTMAVDFRPEIDDSDQFARALVISPPPHFRVGA